MFPYQLRNISYLLFFEFAICYKYRTNWSKYDTALLSDYLKCTRRKEKDKNGNEY